MVVTASRIFCPTIPPTGGFKADPAPKGTEKPAPSEEDAGFVVPPARFLPGAGCSAGFFCRSSARAVPSRFPAALPAPWIPPRSRFRSAPGTPPCRAVLRPALLSWRPQAGNTQRQHPAGGTAQAALAPAGNAFRRISCRIFPQQSRCRASPPPPPEPAPGAASCPASPSAQGVCKNIPHFP